jgi:CMP-2-keto-3-deoxyoctulosonic acid synthetase
MQNRLQNDPTLSKKEKLKQLLQLQINHQIQTKKFKNTAMQVDEDNYEKKNDDLRLSIKKQKFELKQKM